MPTRTWVWCGSLLALLIGVCLCYWAATSENTLWGRGHIYDRLEGLRKAAQADPKDPRPLDELIHSLREGGSFERTHAAIQIGRLGPAGARAVPDLIRTVQGPDLYAAPRAVQALGDIGPPARSAIPLLLKLLKTRTEVGLYSGESLGQIASPDDREVVSALERAASDQDDDDLAYRAKKGLAALEQRRSKQIEEGSEGSGDRDIPH